MPSEAGALAAARWATAAAFFVNGAVFGLWAAQIPRVSADLGLGAGLLGLILLCLGAGAVLAMPLAGAAIARFGSPRVMRLAGLAFCAALAAIPLAPSPALLALVLFGFGAAGGSLDVAMNAHGALVERRLGRAVMSSLHGTWSLGGFFGAGLAAALAAFPPAWQCLAVGSGLALVFALAQRHFLAAADGDAGGPAFALPDRGLLLASALALLGFLVEGALLDWSALHLARDLGASPALAAAGFAAFSASMAAARFAGDALRNRIGAPALMGGGALLGGAGLALTAAAPDPVFAAAGLVLAGFGLANVVPLLFSWAGARDPARAGPAIAALSTFGYGGMLAGPPLIGFVAEIGSLSLGLGLCAAFCLLIAAGAPGASRPSLRLTGRP